jgi:hypothetical protein
MVQGEDYVLKETNQAIDWPVFRLCAWAAALPFLSGNVFDGVLL